MGVNVDEIILEQLNTTGSVDTYELSLQQNTDHQLVVGAVKRLQSLPKNVIDAELVKTERWVLTDEGVKMEEEGSYEARLFNLIPTEGLRQTELEKTSLGKNGKLGHAKGMQKGWLTIDKTCEGGARVLRKVEQITDTVQLALRSIKSGEVPCVEMHKELKSRKLATIEVLSKYLVKRGAEFTLNIEKPQTDITSEMLANGEWKTKEFKDYNFDALGIPPRPGHLHPLMKVRTQYRQIFLEMGFEEMPTNNFVESSFWNFDALFQPQQHPARDAHDTFFIEDPKYSKLSEVPSEYLEKVRTVHEKGAHGSQGYKYKWELEESKKNLLRTHTTAVSSKMLHKLAQRKPFTPAKYFSIDRVFRNETLDATHLAEFHQIEGVVADKNLSLGHLIGILHQFFQKLGMEKLRFKPAYNPYTEPSMEIFSYHEGLGKWIEIGNSGIFRPEMLLPMGLPKNVSVIAWGLSLERPTMIKYGYSNIRDLIGHKIDLGLVYDSPICRLDETE